MFNLLVEDVSSLARPVNHHYTSVIGADGFAIGADDDLAAPSTVYSRSTTGQPDTIDAAVESSI